MKPISWQHVTLAGLATLVVLAILGLCVWLVAAGLAPPSLIAAPISSILLAGSASAVAYMRGLMTPTPAPPGTEFRLVASGAPPPLAPLPPGMEYRAVPSHAPPPPDATLLGRVPLPPATQAVRIRELADAADADPEVDTSRETPAAKGRP